MTDSEQIKLIQQSYGVPQVVLSFGAAAGGALFAQWLRLQIMRERGWSRPNEVYLDTIALASAEGTTFDMRMVRELNGLPTAGGLASINTGWADYYKHALTAAQSMVFCSTAAWFRSPYCGRELNYWIQENEARRKAKKPALRGVALTFADQGTSNGFSGMTEIPCTRSYVVADEKKRAELTGLHRDFWVLDPGTLRRVTLALA